MSVLLKDAQPKNSKKIKKSARLPLRRALNQTVAHL